MSQISHDIPLSTTQPIKSNPSNITYDKENSSLSSNINDHTISNNVQDIKKHKEAYVIRSQIIQANQPDQYHYQQGKNPIKKSQLAKDLLIERSINPRRTKKSLTLEPRNSISIDSSSYYYGQYASKEYDDSFSTEDTTDDFIEKIKKSKNATELVDQYQQQQQFDKDSKSPACSQDTCNHSSTKSSPFDFKNEQIKIIEPYFEAILKSLKLNDGESTPISFLKNHRISAHLRAKMIDWMIEVLSSYKCSDQTFFLAVNYMDLFFQNTSQIHEVSDLHLTGVTCMFMASKYEEIYPLRLSVIYEKIAHRKLSIESIIMKERDILQALDYKLTRVTPYEYLMTALYQLNIKDKMNPKLYEYLQKVCVYLTKMAMHDYDLINEQQYSELAASVLFVAFKIIEQIDKTFLINKKFKQLITILNVDEEIIFDCATKILFMAKNFDKMYENLENLKKFHSLTLDSNPFEG